MNAPTGGRDEHDGTMRTMAIKEEFMVAIVAS